MKNSSIKAVSASWVLIVAGYVAAVAMFSGVLIRWPDNFFADDSYFYFQVAWNIARGMGSTFNTLMPTNGYHPLWMLVCILNFKIFASKAAAVHGIGAFISLLDFGALLLLARTLRRVAPGAWWCAVTIYAPFCFLTQLGTEGALSGFCLATYIAAAYALYLKADNLSGFLCALTGALAVLSRLDNVFIVGLVYLAMLVAAPGVQGARAKRFALLWFPVALVLCGTYLVSNKVWFGTLQPISGILKEHSHGEGTHLRSLPHLGFYGLAMIVPCIAVLARYRRDAFFQLVEVPFALGVFCHAAYILFVMSSETRWSWYYTSWIFLGSIVVSRVASLILERQPERVRIVLATVALVLLIGVWVRGSYLAFAHPTQNAMGEGFEENLVDRLHVHAAIAFDKPGRMAYYTDVPIVTLDGLMGNMTFQQDLAANGIASFDANNGVDAFVGPPVPFDESGKKIYCDQRFLSSVQFHCVPNGAGGWVPDGVEVFARLGGQSAGSLSLPASTLEWNQPGLVSVWHLPMPRR